MNGSPYPRVKILQVISPCLSTCTAAIISILGWKSSTAEHQGAFGIISAPAKQLYEVMSYMAQTITQ